MYTLNSPLGRVTGIGDQTYRQLERAGITTVKELLLNVPLRYEDRSHFTTLAAAPEDTLITFQAKVLSVKTSYRGRRSITTAKVDDGTGSVQLIWFQSAFVKSNLKIGNEYLFSGKINDRHMMVHPVFEPVRAQALHTNRLVPLYTSTLSLKQGTLRRILMHVLDNLEDVEDSLAALDQTILPLPQAIRELHFPSETDLVTQARERLALEELLSLIRHSESVKKQWQQDRTADKLPKPTNSIPENLPFSLTGAQERAISEIAADLNSTAPMNRILIGDVGSGKTVVAGAAATQTAAAGFHSCLVAPTQLLASQHTATLTKLFPKLTIHLLTGRTKLPPLEKPSLIIGTHAVLNQLSVIEPRLIIYDEQHRFGVAHRSQATRLQTHPHVLTMTATPIPRTLLLTIFSHLSVSLLNELPKDRTPTKTWLLSEQKRSDMYTWLAEQMSARGEERTFLTLMVCPFIDQSEHDGLDTVKASTELFQTVKQSFPKHLKVDILHSRLSASAKSTVIAKLFDKKIDILVTTPIVEVGVDLPQASAIVIESAERYGLASLHQLRGRVGRAGQQGYCLLFTSSGKTNSQRLRQFTTIHDGQTLAELDLQRRGAGDLFGTAQHGFDELQFASWTNLELIKRAQSIYKQIPADWEPFFSPRLTTDSAAAN